MKTVSDYNKIEFYKFLNGDTSVEELENFIYTDPDLEKQLGSETYLNLIELNFKDKYDRQKLLNLIKNDIIDEGQFEAWKLKIILNSFLSDIDNIHKYLNKLYRLYFGIYHVNGQRRYEYKFLSNLALNYLYWVDEGYMRANFGDNWESEYSNCFSHFEYYHKQLKPFANEILTALNDNKIQILNDGTYLITEDLKVKLETETIYTLKHPQ